MFQLLSVSTMKQELDDTQNDFQQARGYALNKTTAIEFHNGV